MPDVPLSPVDYVFTGVGSQPITFAFSYKERLEMFPIIPSKLLKLGTHDFVFEPVPPESIFKVVESEIAYTETTNILQYVTPVDSRAGHPLSEIKLTQIPSGSVLAVSVSHALLDGFSYFHFLSSWARICRGDRVLTPDQSREAFTDMDAGSVKSVTPEDVLNRCGLFVGAKRRALGNYPIDEDRFFINKQEIKSYLEEAKKENPEISFTENHIITAFLWKKYIPMWSDGAGNPVVYITCPFDFRRKLRSVPRTYLGCSLCFATASTSYEKLCEARLAELAILVKQSIMRVNQDFILSSLSTLESFRKQKGLAALENLHLRHPDHGMIITNLTRMPIPDLDFGFGAPEHFSMYNEVLRGAAILPAKDGVEVVVAYPSGKDRS